MRYLIVGLGNIGGKRRAVLGDRCVATVDPFNPAADFRRPEECPLDGYDAAILAVPNDVKLKLMEYFLTRGKHVLVEKPLILEAESADELEPAGARRGRDLVHVLQLPLRAPRHRPQAVPGGGGDRARLPGADVLRERHRRQYRGHLAGQPARHPRGHGEPPDRPRRLRLRALRRGVPGVGAPRPRAEGARPLHPRDGRPGGGHRVQLPRLEEPVAHRGDGRPRAHWRWTGSPSGEGASWWSGAAGSRAGCPRRPAR